MLRFASKLLLLHQMQWGIHSFTVGAYSRKKLTIIIECICDAMFVSMVPSVELEQGSKNVSWISVNQCLNCNKCVAASWLSLCLYHDPMEFHGGSRGRTWICMYHRSWPVATGGRTVPGFGIHGWSSIRGSCHVWEKGINYCISASNNSSCYWLLLTVQHLVAVSFPSLSFYKRQQEKPCMTRMFILEWHIAHFPVYEQIS